MLASGASGIVQPSMWTIAAYHPNFALCAMEGVRVRPTYRTIGPAVFPTNDLGKIIPVAFDQQINQLSIFAGASYTIDPTGAFAGNVLKGLSDVTTGQVPGITMTLTVKGNNGTDYAPISAFTPIQLVPGVLSRAAGVWAMSMAESVNAQFQLVAAPTGLDAPFNVWMVFEFLALGEGGDEWLCLSRSEAYQRLRDRFGFNLAASQ